MKITTSRLFMVALLMEFLTANPFDALAAGNQQAQIIASTLNPMVGEDFHVTVRYNVSDSDNTLSGIGLRIYFDSTKIAFKGFSHVFGSPMAKDISPQNDTTNGDNDLETNKFVGIAWADFAGGNWPNQPLPLDIARLNFSVISYDSMVTSSVNIACTSNASGYSFTGTNITLSLGSSTGSISGRVLVNFAGHNGLSVKDAIVSLQNTGYSVSTVNDGNFTLENIPFGNYVLAVNAPDMNTQKQNINLVNENLQVFLLPMTLSTGDINGDDYIGLEDAVNILQYLSGSGH
jgi:hypothetical protein